MPVALILPCLGSHDGCPVCWAGGNGSQRLCQRCMLFITRGTMRLGALLCNLCGVVTLPCTALLKTPYSCSCGNMTAWGCHTAS